MHDVFFLLMSFQTICRKSPKECRTSVFPIDNLRGLRIPAMKSANSRHSEFVRADQSDLGMRYATDVVHRED